MAVGSQRWWWFWVWPSPALSLYMDVSVIHFVWVFGGFELWGLADQQPLWLESDPCPIGLGIRSVFPSAHVLILLYVSLGDMQQGGSGPVIRLLGFKFYPSCTIWRSDTDTDIIVDLCVLNLTHPVSAQLRGFVVHVGQSIPTPTSTHFLFRKWYLEFQILTPWPIFGHF